MCCHPTDFSLPLSLSGLHSLNTSGNGIGNWHHFAFDNVSQTGAEVIHSGSSKEYSYDEKTEGVDHSEEKQRSVEITFVV